jgi:hypothetical protein
MNVHGDVMPEDMRNAHDLLGAEGSQARVIGCTWTATHLKSLKIWRREWDSNIRVCYVRSIKGFAGYLVDTVNIRIAPSVVAVFTVTRLTSWRGRNQVYKI